MYQALYRKWRPQVFEDVVGQEHVTEILRNEIKNGRQAHAYLFTGSRGTGKTTCSKILAKAVNCLQPKQGDPCLVCENCRGIDEGTVLDVVEIDAASNNGVDDVRQLREEAVFTPAQAKYRVYIIDEVHMLSTAAFNALLKIMEEPPAHVIFVLATTEAHKVPATILSRCQRFDFRRIKAEDIAARLKKIVEQEGGSITEEAAFMIARVADGGMRDAISLLDQCMSDDPHVTLERVVQAAGLADRSYLFELAEAILSQNVGDALQIVSRLYELSVDFSRLTEELIGHIRNLMLIKTLKKPETMILCLPDELERMKQQASRVKMSFVLYLLEVLEEALERLAKSPLKRVELEICIVRLCTPGQDSSPAALLHRIEQLEAGKIATTTPLPTVKGAETGEYAPENGRKEKKVQHQKRVIEPEPDDGQKTVSKAPEKEQEKIIPLDCWAEILTTLSKLNPALFGTLGQSTAYLKGDLVLIDCTDRMFFQLIRANDYAKTSLREAIRKHTGKTYRLGPYRPEPKAQTEEPPDLLHDILSQAEKKGIPIHKL